MKLFHVSALSALIALVAFAGFAAAGDPAQTIMSACSKCHDTKRICAKLGTKDKAGWDATVTRMMSKGAQVAEADKAGVVDWLVAQKPGAKPVCE